MSNNRKSRSKGWIGPKLPNDLKEVLEEKINALRSSVKADYLKAEIFSKYVSRETAPPDVRANAALRKWLAAERDNEATTDRLILSSSADLIAGVPYPKFVDFCSGLIAEIIGDTPPIDSLVGSFSGGASTSRSRTYGHPAYKYLGKAHITPTALGVFADVSAEVPGWLGLEVENELTPVLRQGNAMFTVPKKTDIDRVAAKEPDLNMFLQKGIGDHLRAALKRVGINLNDQSINRSLALEGSIHNNLATLDLSSASDSVTTELVFQLLPVTWYTLLDSVRSKSTILIDGEVHRNHMFSSMGNGFTFELESLLFYALMRTTAYFTGSRGVISVYGDDLIIPSKMAVEAVEVLSWFGFQVNPDKTFLEGPFRESCGGHYWNGVDITPFYVKGPIESIPDVIHVANQLREWGEFRVRGERFSSILDPEIEDIWLWLKSLIPSYLWGGEDTSYKYQLVSRDTASQRLHEEAKTTYTGIGGYFHWLNTTWDRTKLRGTPQHQRWWKGTPDSVQTSERSVKTGQLRLKPVRDKTVPRLESHFIHEVVDMTE